jgi:branched-chain amino acid transport system substrate-binding protein
MSRRTRTKRLYIYTGTMASLVAASILMTACSSKAKSSQTGANGLPLNISLINIQDLTSQGTPAVGGIAAKQGYELAVDEINSSKFLGESQVALKFVDDQKDPTVASQLANQAVQGKYDVIFGPITSTYSVAIAPILQRAKKPIIFTQSGSPGVILDQNFFRMTPLQADLLPLSISYLKSKGVKSIAAITPTDNPTAGLLEARLKELAPAAGIAFLGNVTITSTQVDLSGPVSKLLSYKPDAVAHFGLNAGGPAVMTLLNRANFRGPVIGQQGFANGQLAPAGAAADGVVFPMDFFAPGVNAKGKAFTDSYKAKYGTTPTNQSAEAYDAMWFVATAIKQGGSVDPVKLQAALATLGTTGFQGVLSDNITVKDGQEISSGVLVEWRDGKFTAIATP